MSAALEKTPAEKLFSRVEAGSRSSAAQGKADDTDEETGTSSLWDTHLATERVRLVTLHLHIGTPEFYPNNEQ
jgi:hypothetical protein